MSLLSLIGVLKDMLGGFMAKLARAKEVANNAEADTRTFSVSQPFLMAYWPGHLEKCLKRS